MHFTSGSASLGHYEYSTCESGRANDSCSQNRSDMKERNKCGEVQLFFFSKRNDSPVLSCIALEQFLLLFLFFPSLSFIFSPCLFRSPVSPFWHAMTVTVVYKSPLPWTVSACLFWDETTAIRSSARRIPALSAPTLLPNPPHPAIDALLWCCADIWNHLVCFQAKYR